MVTVPVTVVDGEATDKCLADISLAFYLIFHHLWSFSVLINYL